MRSNTPLQGLTLLNDPALFEIAQGLATRILAERPAQESDRDRLEYALKICLGRKGTDQEVKMLEIVLKTERAELESSSRTKGGGKSPAGQVGKGARSEWVTVARVLLNLDEFVTRE